MGRSFHLRNMAFGLLLLASPALAGQDAGMTTPKPLPDRIVIAHRGASGERPEHTIAAYKLAIAQGADVIEPDLVPAKDGVLVARHENNIAETTDVADHPEFKDRRATKTIDGEKQTGWFTEDFSLAELKTLRARERLPMLRAGNKAYDGQEAIPTFAEVIALAKQASAETGRTIGIYPETKHPTYFRSIGLPLEDTLLAQLGEAGWDSADAPVFIQSFEVANLRALAGRTKVRLIQLMTGDGGPADGAEPSYAAMATPEGFKTIAGYAWGVGVNKDWIAKDPDLVARAHAAGLKVHLWTFRAENYFLGKPYRRGLDPRAHGDIAGEIGDALKLGIDGAFSDFPLEARRAFDAHQGK